MDEPGKPPRGPSRLATLIAVVFIVAVLVALILPVIGRSSHGHSREAMCGYNQFQICGALVAYSTQYEVAYPGPPDPALGTITDARRARQATMQMLGILARDQRLPPSLLVCPRSKCPRPQPFDGPRPPLDWGIVPGSAVYALDWAAPEDASSARIVLADRDPAAHLEGVMAVFGDGHSKLLRCDAGARKAAGLLVTEGPDGKPIAVSVSQPARVPTADEPEVLPPDDLYSDAGDRQEGGEPLTVGKGDPVRAWVK